PRRAISSRDRCGRDEGLRRRAARGHPKRESRPRRYRPKNRRRPAQFCGVARFCPTNRAAPVISCQTAAASEMGSATLTTTDWLRLLRKRRERMYAESLDLSMPITWESAEEREAAIAFFNAAFRAEESGLRQAHEIADEIREWDPELAEVLKLYGDEEGWH